MTARLAKFIRLLGSDKPGEVVAAAGAINRALQSRGTDIHALAEVVESQFDVPLVPRQQPTTKRPAHPAKTRAFHPGAPFQKDESIICDEPAGLFRRCRCGSTRFTVMAGVGPHVAQLRCDHCGTGGRWLSRAAFWRGAMTEIAPDHAATATTFLREYFRGTQGPLYLSALRNSKSKLSRGELANQVTRKSVDVIKFLDEHDKRERECGIYYCTATLKDGSTSRSATDCQQFPSLFADVDDKNHALTRARRSRHWKGWNRHRRSSSIQDTACSRTGCCRSRARMPRASLPHARNCTGLSPVTRCTTCRA